MTTSNMISRKGVALQNEFYLSCFLSYPTNLVSNESLDKNLSSHMTRFAVIVYAYFWILMNTLNKLCKIMKLQ